MPVMAAKAWAHAQIRTRAGALACVGIVREEEGWRVRKEAFIWRPQTSTSEITSREGEPRSPSRPINDLTLGET